MLLDHNKCVTTLAFSLDNKFIVSVFDDKTVKIWNIATKKCVPYLRDYDGKQIDMFSEAVSPDGVHIAAKLRNRKLVIYTNTSLYASSKHGYTCAISHL